MIPFRPYTNAKVERIIGGAGGASEVNDFDPVDFIALAAACLDQAGCSTGAVIAALDRACASTSPFRKPELREALETMTDELRAEDRAAYTTNRTAYLQKED